MHNAFSDPVSTKKWLLVRLTFFVLFVGCTAACKAQTNDTVDAEATYTHTINQRAEKIVATLGLSDANKTSNVRAIIAQHYRDLNTIHQARDSQIKVAKVKFGADQTAANTAIQAARSEVKPRLDKLHAGFLARLLAELSPGQVDKVKDGLTYGVVQGTYNVYLKMYPALTIEQKRQIMEWLVEAREIAMDGSTSGEKHAVFGRYKGKINNYLSKAGYDAKKGEQNLKNATKPPLETESK